MSGIDRRAVLAALGAAPLAALAACARRPRLKPTQALVPLSDVPVGGRKKVLVAGRPVELRRADDGSVTARSLLCTHFGCTVAWDEAKQAYLCPCHEGVYDAAGAVVSGPPPKNLSPVPVAVAGNDVVVGA